jgi:hypothetical protein
VVRVERLSVLGSSDHASRFFMSLAWPRTGPSVQEELPRVETAGRDGCEDFHRIDCLGRIAY